MNDRHHRQTLFRHIGPAGQARLAAGSAVIVGVGATGGAIAESLARAGVGRLTLVDRDFPERSNLQRQVLFVDADVDRGIPKALAAAEHLLAIDPGLAVQGVVADFHAGNAQSLLAGHDVVVDGTDNFAARFVLNDAAVMLGIPWIYCGAVGAHGATMSVAANGQPCLRCLYPSPPPPGSLETCDTAGVLQPAVATVAAVAAMAAMKLLLGAPAAEGEMTYVDLWARSWQSFHVPAVADCPTCARRQFPALVTASAEDAVATALCGRDAVHVRPREAHVDLAALARRLETATPVQLANQHLVRFAASGCDITVFADGRAIVKGTDDPVKARALYARYIGH